MPPVPVQIPMVRTHHQPQVRNMKLIQLTQATQLLVERRGNLVATGSKIHMWLRMD